MALNLSKDSLTFWLQENQQKLFWALTIAFVPLSLLFYFASKNSRSNWEDYLQAGLLYQKWAENPKGEAENFQKLIKLTNSHTGLHEKYGSLIAEKCIALNQSALAGTLVDRSLNQIKDQIPYHHLFSKTSILIADGKYDEALNEAAALKEKIEKESMVKQCSVLFLFNLIRIASLERSLNHCQNELASLENIKKWVGSENCTQEAKLALSNSFYEGSISFLDYIEYRTKNGQ
ncbi:MAG TPA: hypothetical protein VLG76_06190 [Rhabdochlamydiaceae bacterium]|nr:hypothetical protein [Rhabdochlamydiaceae bacterium]